MGPGPHSRPKGENVSYGAVSDPFAPPGNLWYSFSNAILATTLFRCWHILIFFGAWSTAVSLISHSVYSLAIQSTLLTVFGTVLGFIISYRTTSSFERYNEGRRLWSQIVLGSRTFARAVWFHVADTVPSPPGQYLSVDELKARTLVEKKTVLNLLEAFAVAVKHYLRGEDGIYYEDLYHLVKFLPPYALPPGRPSFSAPTDENNGDDMSVPASPSLISRRQSASKSHLPLPTTTRTRTRSIVQPSIHINGQDEAKSKERVKVSTGPGDDSLLLPSRMPPKFSLFDLFPFSLFVRQLTNRGLEVKGRKAARARARLQTTSTSHNIPLEISLYLSSYISAVQARKLVDAPTTTMLFTTLNGLVDALTGLERILTTPIPFSYSMHLWTVTALYCLALPFQLWTPLKWLTIPATVIASWVFFGFLAAGEEIENPFGYDKNDLNMDHFVHNIIRNELRAITALPTPDPSVWAFSLENDLLFASRTDEPKVTPAEWLERGAVEMLTALAAGAP